MEIPIGHIRVAEIGADEILFEGTVLVPVETGFISVAGGAGAVDDAHRAGRDEAAGISVAAVNDAVGIGDGCQDGGGGGAPDDGRNSDSRKELGFRVCPRQ